MVILILIRNHLSLLNCLKLKFLKGMDIPDVELVIVNGAPDSMLQFYQVLYILFYVVCLYTMIIAILL